MSKELTIDLRVVREACNASGLDSPDEIWVEQGVIYGGWGSVTRKIVDGHWTTFPELFVGVARVASDNIQITLDEWSAKMLKKLVDIAPRWPGNGGPETNEVFQKLSYSLRKVGVHSVGLPKLGRFYSPGDE